MLDTLKEHVQEFAADALLKHVLPSLIMSEAALLAKYLHYADGHQVFSPKSVHALTALIIIGVNYSIHLWFYLKRLAAAKKAQA